MFKIPKLKFSSVSTTATIRKFCENSRTNWKFRGKVRKNWRRIRKKRRKNWGKKWKFCTKWLERWLKFSHNFLWNFWEFSDEVELIDDIEIHAMWAHLFPGIFWQLTGPHPSGKARRHLHRCRVTLRIKLNLFVTKINFNHQRSILNDNTWKILRETKFQKKSQRQESNPFTFILVTVGSDFNSSRFFFQLEPSAKANPSVCGNIFPSAHHLFFVLISFLSISQLVMESYDLKTFRLWDQNFSILYIIFPFLEEMSEKRI